MDKFEIFDKMNKLFPTGFDEEEIKQLCRAVYFAQEFENPHIVDFVCMLDFPNWKKLSTKLKKEFNIK